MERCSRHLAATRKNLWRGEDSSAGFGTHSSGIRHPGAAAGGVHKGSRSQGVYSSTAAGPLLADFYSFIGPVAAAAQSIFQSVPSRASVLRHGQTTELPG